MKAPGGGKIGSGMDRRQALIAGGAATGLALVLPRVARAAAAPVAQTISGKIRGYNNGPVKVFKGIPYGAPTGGANRFMPARPVQPWSGIRDATKLGHQAPQGADTGIIHAWGAAVDHTPMGEDCLALNVWTPQVGSNSGKRPVMVWFHGGGYARGSGGWISYDGTNLARFHDVVLVTVNHRLNAFGFLYLAGAGGDRFADSGNVGVLDLVSALEWVRDNISDFGGDPNNVTIFGQSGGGGKVTTLMGMVPAKGLFHRAIAESGLDIRAGTIEQAERTTDRLMRKLGLKPSQVDELQKMPWQKIVAAQAAFAGPDAGAGAGLRLGPVVDHRSIPANPFDPVATSLSADVPLILGSVLTEVTFFANTPLGPIDDKMLHELVKQNTRSDDAETDRLIVLYKKDYPAESNVRIYQIIASDNWMTADVALVAERRAALNKAPSYVYHFEKHVPADGGKLGTPHTSELYYVFDNVDLPTAKLMVGTGKDRIEMAAKMSGAWTAFARTGKPDIASIPPWPGYSAAQRNVMILNDTCKVVVDPHAAEREAMGAVHKRNGMPAPA